MTIEEEISKWLRTRLDWQQEAALRILKNGTLTDSDFIEITALCKTPEGQKATSTRKFPGLFKGKSSSTELCLLSIGNIQGIENLAPRSPLTFGGSNLSIVFGNNGSGKSGYARILKKASGKLHAAELRSNVYESSPSKQCCNIEYETGGAVTSVEWHVTNDPIPDLLTIDIFDADCGNFYLSKENEASYTPPILSLFDELVRACMAVRQQLKNNLMQLPSKLPSSPVDLANTKIIRTYNDLKPFHTEGDIAALLVWSDDDANALHSLEERLKIEDPAKLVVKKRARKKQLEAISSKLERAADKLSPEACQKTVSLKLETRQKRFIAIEGAKAVLDSANLAGIGGDSWRALWEAARLYSDQEAYPQHKFPNTDAEASCVLCQQALQPEAKARMRDFEQFVTGELESAAKAAESARDKAFEELPKFPDESELRTSCQAADIDLESWLPRLVAAWKTMFAISQVLKIPDSEVVPQGVEIKDYPWIEELNDLAKTLDEQATQHDADSASFDRGKALQQKNELLARRWTSQQAEAIKSELQRLNKSTKLNALVDGTNYTAISRQAGVVAEKTITDAYINRFNEELNKLGATHIRVELTKTRTTRGKAMHAIRLTGLKTSGVSPAQILSEGEKRIVELAAFLADVTGMDEKTPFIFDDPISSLDQNYEEKTIERLIELSLDRQVLIFTHRLSFLGILSDKSSPNTVCIRHEPWGAGNPGDVPLFGKKPDSALKKLRDERLKQAENLLNSEGSEVYYPLAKAICSDLRVLVERIVELVFLGDVIQRHRREVHTKGKVGRLIKITATDCELIDKYMGKYSRYEHSQSSEAPVNVPPPNELRSDIDELLSWHYEFKARPARDSV